MPSQANPALPEAPQRRAQAVGVLCGKYLSTLREVLECFAESTILHSARRPAAFCGVKGGNEDGLSPEGGVFRDGFLFDNSWILPNAVVYINYGEYINNGVNNGAEPAGRKPSGSLSVSVGRVGARSPDGVLCLCAFFFRLEG